MSIGDLCRVKKSIFLEQLKVIRLYYPKSFRFAVADLLLALFGFVFNPYRISRKFLQKKGAKNIYTYGETPLTTLHKITDFGGLSSSDTFFELGSGRGKGCFWASTFIDCKVVALEWIPLFSKASRFIGAIAGFKKINFQCTDFQKADFSKATFVYFYGITMTDEETLTLAKRLEEQLASGAKVVTISERLPTDLKFRFINSFPVTYVWGETVAYTHVRI